MRKKRFEIVDSLTIGSPCPVDDFKQLSEQRGNDRFCYHCHRHVFDLSKMSRSDIAALIDTTGGDFCASIRRRLDGSIVTAERTDATRQLIAAGALLASTALLSGVAVAEEDVGYIEIADESPTPTETASPDSDKSGDTEHCERETVRSDNDTHAPQPTHTPPLRGRVKVER